MTDPKVHQILNEIDVSALPEDEQEALLIDIGAAIASNSMARVLERMTPESGAEAAMLIDQGAEDTVVDAFIRSHVEDPDACMQEALKDAASAILAVTGTKQ